MKASHLKTQLQRAEKEGLPHQPCKKDQKSPIILRCIRVGYRWALVYSEEVAERRVTIARAVDQELAGWHRRHDLLQP